jgi:hypothetical protein
LTQPKHPADDIMIGARREVVGDADLLPLRVQGEVPREQRVDGVPP